jgi:hypothetical protein
MNAYRAEQTSGNSWPPTLRLNRAYRPPQGVLAPPEPKRDREILEDFENQMAEFLVANELALLQVRKYYVLSSVSSVTEFLNEHRTIPQLLLQAHPHLRQYFGDTVFSLRTNSDEYGWEKLYVAAMWPGSVEEAMDALESFQEHWWLQQFSLSSGRLTFTYELV